MVAVSILLSGCGTESAEKPIDTATQTNKGEENQTPDSPYTNVVKIDTNQETPTVRAQIDTDSGELYVVSEGKEAIGHITTPSVLGKEGDFYYQGNYSVMYKHNEEEKEIKELKDIVFVQPSDQPISFEKISFEAMDVFLLTPEYTSSRGYNSYAFGIDKKSGEAFAITFKNGENVQDVINYEKDSVPVSTSEKLVVTTRNTEGQGDTLTTEYSFDQDSKQFVAE
ncbi:hypothetical protein ASD24_24380 [Paenibacillus sp. Root52]|uniref:hypothetical protein n=1 Tax=Paenibacillus sp. Root52 TaxID=1736552 RepID=UPI0006F85677|nr:hypothetical protein [Paenibacillus sp. Root52]KQY90938.1 hypothetical protein ASD24_24380 [Paenibacillus sp. Root52]